MENIWEVPDKEFVKINFHYILSPDLLPNGNIDGVGVIIRYEYGEKQWTAMGSMNALAEEEAIMAVL